MPSYWHKDLWPRPSEDRVWSPTKQYKNDDVVWFEGIEYRYIGSPTPKTTEEPTIDTFSNEYRADLSVPTGSGTFRTDRSWVMFDPARDRAPYGFVPGPVASVTSANIRGFDALAKVPESEPFPDFYTKGVPAYAGDVGSHTTRREKDSSYLSKLDSGNLSVIFGPSQPIPDKVNGYTVQNNYYLPAGMIPGIQGQGNNAGSLTIGGSRNFILALNNFEDNQGWLASRREGTTNGPINDSITGNQTFTKTYNIQLVLPGIFENPIDATITASLIGTDVNYRLMLEYYTYQAVTVPPPYIGGNNTTKYYRTGGTLVLVSGDGVNTPRVYEWQPPYDELVQEEVDSGQYTLEYGSPAPVVTKTVTKTNVLIGAGSHYVLYSTLSPVHPR